MIRFGKIARFLLYLWVAIFFIMLLAVILKPSPTHNWFPTLMWTLMYIWIILILPVLLGAIYMVWNHMKRRLSEMTDEEIVEYWANRFHSHFNP
jgi:hypothetical protein